MVPGIDRASYFDQIDLGGDFPDIDDVEGYVEQVDYFDRSKTTRTYFYRLGNTLSVNFVPCADVDCEGAYFIKDILLRAYGPRTKHFEGTLPCPVCERHHRKGNWCNASFSVDIVYKTPAQEPEEGPTVPSPDERYDLY